MGPKVKEPAPEKLASSQLTEERIVQSLRKRNPAAFREMECHPALCKYWTRIERVFYICDS